MDTPSRQLYTIGHSTRSLEELLHLIGAHQIECLADVRTVPRSRHTPQFNREALAADLPKAGLRYIHLPRLGGLRKSRAGESPNSGWRSAGFRGFADYMQTGDFGGALDELWNLAGLFRTTLMCAEALYWRCHRALIADAFTVRGGVVFHIHSGKKIQTHPLTPFAVVSQGRIIYPPPDENQQSLLR